MEEKKLHQVTIRLEPELKRKIEEQALYEHRHTAEFIRHCVQIYLEKVEEVRRITF